jgi:hypothetical protein
MSANLATVENPYPQ